ncbi:hypothetical protein KALB_8098 [Kutzneria albida DSM 43870]|uniref:Uncharacterized protein n=2 Tax=Kutzneria TaxID=43356 RepID=W5WL10_9PSEU|nr:hypothetical protein KALB_8098 [Kutzneria albida DSM 43870]
MDGGRDLRLTMHENHSSGEFHGPADESWFGEPSWPVRRSVLPPWSAREFGQQALIPLPRRSEEWLD